MIWHPTRNEHLMNFVEQLLELFDFVALKVPIYIFLLAKNLTEGLDHVLELL